MGHTAIQGQGWLQNPVSQFMGCLSSSGVPPWRRGLTKTELDFLKVFIYLAVPGLSCSIQDVQSAWQHAGSLVAAYGI